jgi:acetolactate synthase-1/2/3 large subunit
MTAVPTTAPARLEIQTGPVSGDTAQSTPSTPTRTLTNVTVAQVLLAYLQLEGANTLFGVPGAACMHLLAQLKQQRAMFRYIVTRHETGAAYMADGYARLSNRLGVVLTTSGPSAINALTGSMNAEASGVSLLTITGEVPEQFFGMGYLQEGTDRTLDVDDVYRAATGYSTLVASPLDFATLFQQALRDALTVPHHAVHVSLPDDVAAASIASINVPAAPHNYRTVPQVSDRRRAELALRRLLSVDRPLILAGSGARVALESASGRRKFSEIVSRFAIPVMTTADAKAVFPESHEMSLRSFGTSFCEWTKYYMAPHTLDPSLPTGFDALLVLGSQLDGLATNKFDPILLPTKSLIQVDLDSSVIGRVFPLDFGIIADIATVIDDMHDVAMTIEPDEQVAPRRAFIQRIKRASPYLDAKGRDSLQSPILPQTAMKCLSDLLPPRTAMFFDAGNCFGWGLHYLTLDESSSIYSSLAMGPMGWGICATIGAKLAAPDRTCIAVAGDGAFLMHGTEISTAAAHGVGAIIVVLNDNDLAMVSQGMNQFFPDPSGGWRDYYAIGQPDIARLAQSLGAEAYNVSSVEDMEHALPAAIRAADLDRKPQVIVVHIDTSQVPPFYQDPGVSPPAPPPSHQPINPPGWPTPVGPFNQAIKVGDQLFVSGQGPMDQTSGKFVLGSIEDQTRRTLTNVRTIVEAAGGTMADVTMVNVHLADLSTFAAMNGVYQEFFPSLAPARATVGSTLIEGIGIEIDCVAVLKP